MSALESTIFFRGDDEFDRVQTDIIDVMDDDDEDDDVSDEIAGDDDMDDKEE